MSFEIDKAKYEAVLQGDLSVFEQVVHHYQGTVRAIITSRLNDPFEAYDLTQEVFLVAYRRWPDFDYRRPLRPWLLGIALKLVARFHEKRRAIPVGAEEEVRTLLDRQVEQASPAWQDAPLLEALELCLEKLETSAQTLIRQRYVEDRPISEIQAYLGQKHSAVTMKLYRLRKQLQHCIESRLPNQPVS